MSDALKVLVVDDTITYRLILANIVKKLPNTELAGQAQNGIIAVRKVKELKPDLILLDIEMPEMDGIETLKKIREFDNDVEVIIVSGVNPENAMKTLETLNHGALDFIPKATGKSQEESMNDIESSLRPLIDAVTIKRNLRLVKSSTTTSAPPQKDLDEKKPVVKPRIISNPPSKVDYVLIGISTGGPNALSTMFPTLSNKINCPILIVQHMPPMFTKQLAERLDTLTDLTVKEAQDGDTPKPGEVYIAPGGIHMALKSNGDEQVIRLVDSPPVNSCKPAVDVLYKSIPKNLHKNVLSVIMTGMGADGAAGINFLKDKGAYSIIQDEKSCTIFGMPAAVKENNDYDEEIPLSEIGQRISQIVLKNKLF